MPRRRLEAEVHSQSWGREGREASVQEETDKSTAMWKDPQSYEPSVMETQGRGLSLITQGRKMGI